tara:strand:- start:157 stop:381 length:225 start_codon:yes stop_codon:yes gene_type:complete
MRLIWSKITGFIRAVILPDFVLGKEKALAGFAAPLIVGAVASLAGKHIAPGIVEQLVFAVITSITVHQTTNTGR